MSDFCESVRVIVLIIFYILIGLYWNFNAAKVIRIFEISKCFVDFNIRSLKELFRFTVQLGVNTVRL